MRKVRILSGELKKSPGDAGYDLTTLEDTQITIDAHHPRTFVFKTGLRIAMPYDMYADVRGRSGITLKGMDVKSTKGELIRVDFDVKLGLIDSNYRGDIGVIASVKDTFYHPGRISVVVPAGMRIAQLVFNNLPEFEFDYTDEEHETERGSKGFGSSGL